MSSALGRSVVLAALAAACHPADERFPLLDGRELAQLGGLSPTRAMPPAVGNAFAEEPSAATLGERLFFDAGLSEGERVSCATCHDPARGFTDGRPRAVGLAPGLRNAPTLLGAPWSRFFSWDGRKDSIWAQALAALETQDEHGCTRAGVALRVADAHRGAFEAAFGALPDLSDRRRFPRRARPVPADADHPDHRAWIAMDVADRDEVDRIFVLAGKSLEAYVRTLKLEPAPFDRYVAAVVGGDPSGGGHVSASAVRGLRAFLGEARCILCHHGPLLSDREFHNVGPPPAFGAPESDPGRGRGVVEVKGDPFRCGSRFSDAHECPSLRFLDARADGEVGAFRTPTLRSVAETAPYMHGGQIETLEEVIDFYRTLPGEPVIGRRDPLLQPFGRDVSTEDLAAFLRSLTADAPPGRGLD